MNKQAEETLYLLEEGEYNDYRPSEAIIRDLLEVVLYLHNRVKDLEGRVNQVI